MKLACLMVAMVFGLTACNSGFYGENLRYEKKASADGIKQNEPSVSNPNVPAVNEPEDEQEDSEQEEQNATMGGPATGQVTISVVVAQPANPGRYQPRHLRAFWVTDMNDVRVKTISANPGLRPQHLRRWRVSNAGQVDGFTGATITEYDPNPQEIVWDLTNQDGLGVDQGSYKVWFEVTESNTNDNFVDGDVGYKVHSVVVNVGSQASTVTDNNNTSFQNISINHQP